MSKNRYVNTQFWRDYYITTLKPEAKLLFLYLITGPEANIAGIYQIPLSIMHIDTGLNEKTIARMLNKFNQDFKLIYNENWIVMKNSIKHQKRNPNVQKGIDRIVEESPEWAISFINNKQNQVLTDNPSKDSKAFQSLPKESNYLNLNLNVNLDQNSNLNLDCVEIFDCWNLQEKLITHKVIDKFKPKILAKLNKKYKKAEILKAILNYNTVVNNSKYFWSYGNWSLDRFLDRGLDRFLPENNPLVKLVSKDYKNDDTDQDVKDLIKEMETQDEGSRNQDNAQRA